MVLGGDFDNNSNLNGYVYSVYMLVYHAYLKMSIYIIHMRSMIMQAQDGEFKGMSCKANNAIDNNGSI